jgi:hypothetical protein
MIALESDRIFDGETAPAHQQHQGKHSLGTKTAVFPTAVLILFCCSDNLLKFSPIKVIGRWTMKDNGLFEHVHGICREPTIGSTKYKK